MLQFLSVVDACHGHTVNLLNKLSVADLHPAGSAANRHITTSRCTRLTGSTKMLFFVQSLFHFLLSVYSHIGKSTVDMDVQPLPQPLFFSTDSVVGNDTYGWERNSSLTA